VPELTPECHLKTVGSEEPSHGHQYSTVQYSTVLYYCPLIWRVTGATGRGGSPR